MVQVQTWTWGPASDVCLAEGHIPARYGTGEFTTGGELLWGPTECLRCGAVLNAESEIPER